MSSCTCAVDASEHREILLAFYVKSQDVHAISSALSVSVQQIVDVTQAHAPKIEKKDHFIVKGGFANQYNARGHMVIFGRVMPSGTGWS